MANTLIEPKDRYAFRLGLIWLWLTIFIGFFVKFEPAPYDLLMAAMILVFAITGLLRLPVGSGMPLLLLGLFAVSNVVACYSSLDYFQSVRYMAITFYLALSFVFIMCLICQDFERVMNVVWSAYLASAVCAAVFAALAYYHIVPGLETVTKGVGRAYGTFKDPNVLAPFLVPPTIYFFSKFEQGNSKWSSLAIVAVLITVAGLLLASSRAAAGNLTVTFLIYLLLRVATAKNWSSVRRLLLCALLVVGAGAAVVLWLILNTHVGETFEAKAMAMRYYDGHRFATQRKGLETILSWPFGVGPGTAKEALGMHLATHSLYIQVLVEAGWLAGVAFFSLLVMTLVRSLNVLLRGLRDPRFFVALASLMGQMANTVVVDATHWRHFWLLLGLVWGQLLVASYHQEAQAQLRYAAFPAARRSEGPASS